jgi:hypothetical protein
MDNGTLMVRCALFKWLQAGWSGLNMVRRKHIYSGQEGKLLDLYEIPLGRYSEQIER